jgi:hypothetical protein
MGFLGLRKADQREWTWQRGGLQFLFILAGFSPALVSGSRGWAYWPAVVMLPVLAVVMVWRIWRSRNSSVGSIDQPYVPDPIEGGQGGQMTRSEAWSYVVFVAAMILGLVVGYYD